jgi:hypothetical protein
VALCGGGVAVVRLAIQLLPSALGRWLVAPVGVVLFCWFVPSYLAAVRGTPAGRRLGVAVLLGFALDTALFGAAALERAGAAATCNPGGAGKWRDEYAETLVGATVVIVADRDKPGRKHARQVETSLRKAGCSVQVVEAAEGKDAADHLAAGYGLDDFQPLPEAASDDLSSPSALWSQEVGVRWPVMGQAAFHGLAGEIVRALEPQTEADKVGLPLSFLATFGNLVGPGPHAFAGGEQHPAPPERPARRRHLRGTQGHCAGRRRPGGAARRSRLRRASGVAGGRPRQR